MKRHLLICAVILLVFLCIGLLLSQYPTFSANNSAHYVFVIDAGHGGADGGAISCTGASEANINLQIALRLADTMHLLGLQTKEIRRDDRSVHTSGTTIASKKVSDLKNRVRIVNNTSDAFLISIHQNQFEQSRYSGAQVFYGKASCKMFAENMQSSLISAVNTGSNRKAKKSKGIYLMEHIEKPGILIECGFLSNPAEEKKLQSPEYQKKLCCVIASKCSEFQGALDRNCFSAIMEAERRCFKWPDPNPCFFAQPAETKLQSGWAFARLAVLGTHWKNI